MSELPDLPPPVTDGCIRVALVGDVVGKPGLRVTCSAVPWLRHEANVATIIVNAENAADGSGLRCKDLRRLRQNGVDAVTLGDHVYRKREIMTELEGDEPIVRPLNLPSKAPGKRCTIVETKQGVKVAVLSALGRVFMRPVDCPFHAVQNELEQLPADVHIKVLDFHAEATSDMQVMGRLLDGRVSAVLGTHTHVPTADEQILPKGTGFISAPACCAARHSM